MDNITLQLNSPITEDQWDAITDVDFENTKEILFTTKHKKNVRFVKAQRWIPFSERLPEEDGDYLVCYEEEYRKDYGFSKIGIAPYEVDSEHFGVWTEEFDLVSMGSLGTEFVEIDVVAWMPLPEPYEGEEE